MRISCSDSSMCAETSATRSWLTRESRRTRRPSRGSAPGSPARPARSARRAWGWSANSSTSAPTIISELRRNIEKPKPITCRICSVSLVRREAISPVRAESKNAGESVEHVREHRLAQVGDDALAHAHHEVEAHPRRAREHDGRPRRRRRAPRSAAAGRRCRNRRPPRAAAPGPARARSSPRRRSAHERAGDAAAVGTEKAAEAQEMDEIALGRSNERRSHSHAAILASVAATAIGKSVLGDRW